MKALFLDRDGVINKDSGYVHKIEDFYFNEGIFKFCNYFSKNNYQIVVITNQSGIGRGYYSHEQFSILNNWMKEKFKVHNIRILDVLYCPHLPEENCICRKPNSGLFIEAQLKHNIEMADSWAIGDKERDIIAASNSGVENTILLNSNSEKIKTSAKYTLTDLGNFKISL